jgi:phosphoglycerate dehydrogenase-like enzyme
MQPPNVQRIAIIKSTADAVDPALDAPAFHRLKRLEAAGLITLSIVPLDHPQGIEPQLHSYNAILTRPKWGGVLTDEHFRRASQGQKIPIATLSISTSKIQAPVAEKSGRVKILSAKYGNIDSTAELAIWMAITLRRRLQAFSVEMPFGYWNSGRQICGGLKGISWSIIGAGKLGSRVLARLPGLGIARIFVWHDSATKPKFKQLLTNADLEVVDGMDSGIVWTEGAWMARVRGNPGFGIDGISVGPKTTEVHFDKRLPHVVSNGDVISAVLGIDPPPVNANTATNRTRRSNRHRINSRLLSRMKPSAVLLNLGRAEVLAPDVYRKIYPQLQLCAGLGADVLEEGLEDRKWHSRGWSGESDRLWEAAAASALSTAQQAWATVAKRLPKEEATPLFGARITTEHPLPRFPGEPGNIILTPHVGGATPESEHMIAEEVVRAWVRELGLESKYLELQHG